MKTVLITGGAGFLGSHLAEQFLNEGYRVICVDDFSSEMHSNVEFLKQSRFNKSFLFLEQDVSKPWTWASTLNPRWMAGLKYVFHFASPASPPRYQEIPKETLWVNSIGLENCMALADRYSARVIFASTSEIYGDPEVSPQPESYWGNVNSFGARSCYDEGKRFGEALMYSHNQVHQTRHGLVRIFNTYGPRMNPTDGRVIVNLLAQGLRGEPLTIYGDGTQTRSFCYVDDLVSGIIRYAKSGITEPINIGNPNEFTLLELVEMCRKVLPDMNLKIEFKPLPENDPKRRRPDIQKAQRHLNGWTPRVQLREGLMKTLEWLCQQEGFEKYSHQFNKKSA